MKYINTVDTLDEDFLQKRKDVVKQLSIYNNLLKDRITYIVEEICKVFELNYETWWYYNSNKSDFESSEKQDFFNINIMYTTNKIKKSYEIDLIICLKDGVECELYNIPKRWLIEDFEEELEQGRKVYLQKIINKRKKARERSSKKKEEEKLLIDAVKKKLTPNELKILKKIK